LIQGKGGARWIVYSYEISVQAVMPAKAGI
jgi:hypothetical protein